LKGKHFREFRDRNIRICDNREIFDKIEKNSVDKIIVMIYMRTNIFLFLLSIFLDFIFLLNFLFFIDDEEAYDCSHMTCHIM